MRIFQDLTDDEIHKSLHCSQSKIVKFPKDSYIFQQYDTPTHLYLILSGTVLMGQVTTTGRTMYAEYLLEGSCFGEVDLMLGKPHYEYASKAKTDVTLLAVDKHFFVGVCPNNCAHHERVIYNMLHVFAEASERITTKVQLLTSGSLRQRIAYYLQIMSQGRARVELPLNREELAIHLNTTRPSLSRELSYLQDIGVIYLEGRKTIRILNQTLLQDEIDGTE